MEDILTIYEKLSSLMKLLKQQEILIAEAREALLRAERELVSTTLELDLEKNGDPFASIK